jgi:hypothetical protein
MALTILDLQPSSIGSRTHRHTWRLNSRRVLYKFAISEASVFLHYWCGSNWWFGQQFKTVFKTGMSREKGLVFLQLLATSFALTTLLTAT